MAKGFHKVEVKWEATEGQAVPENPVEVPNRAKDPLAWLTAKYNVKAVEAVKVTK